MFVTVRAIAAILLLIGVSGCGLSAVHREGVAYHQMLDDIAAADFQDCTTASRATSFAQRKWGAAQDCFDLVVKRSPVRYIGRDYQQIKLDNAYTVIDQFALMAMFSKMVYHRYENVDKRNTPDACSPKPQTHPIEALYPPGGEGQGGTWKLWNKDGEGCWTKGGLFFETYVYYPKGGDKSFTKAVIAFRGTENYQSQRFADWSDNFKAAFNEVPTQYEIAADAVLKVISALENDSKGQPALEIYATGHSLGGGLAQLAAYRSDRIRAAYAFNSSPVTGWTWLSGYAKKQGQKLVSDPQIYRVWQRGEGLQFLRRVSSGFNSDRFGRSDYEFDFRALRKDERGGFKQLVQGAVHEHDIGLLACNMAMRVALSHGAMGADTTAEFDYSGAMARNVLNQSDKLVDIDPLNEQLCTSEVLKEIRWDEWNRVDLGEGASSTAGR